MPHVPGPIRQTILDAFDGKGAWTKGFDGRGALDAALGRLWQSTDVVPSGVRDDARDWLVQVGFADPDDAVRLNLSTFAQLVRNLKPAVAWAAQHRRLRLGHDAA